MDNAGSSEPSGSLTLEVIRAADARGLNLPDAFSPGKELGFLDIVRLGMPQRGLSDFVNVWRAKNQRHLWRGGRRVVAAKLQNLAAPYGQLYATVFRDDGDVDQLGLVSLRVVTTAGVNKIVAALNTTDAATATTFKYHEFGTGGTAEAAADTALVTAVETRGTGTQTVGASNNIYRTVGTCTATASRAITEHGVFSASSAGTLLDRSLFTVINLASADAVQFTYELTLPAGS